MVSANTQFATVVLLCLSFFGLLFVFVFFVCLFLRRLAENTGRKYSPKSRHTTLSLVLVRISHYDLG